MVFEAPPKPQLTRGGGGNMPSFAGEKLAVSGVAGNHTSQVTFSADQTDFDYTADGNKGKVDS